MTKNSGRNTMPTTVQVDADLMKEARIRAIEMGLTYSKFVGLAIRKELDRQKQGDMFKEGIK
jgi:post-segregation antitoxin (ccd killing protein)